MASLSDRLKRRLQQVVGLNEREADQVVREVLDLFDQTVDEFIVSRHAELQGEGQKTQASFAQIKAELDQWRYQAPALSVRQIRRRIYG